MARYCGEFDPFRLKPTDRCQTILQEATPASRLYSRLDQVTRANRMFVPRLNSEQGNLFGGVRPVDMEALTSASG